MQNDNVDGHGDGVDDEEEDVDDDDNDNAGEDGWLVGPLPGGPVKMIGLLPAGGQRAAYYYNSVLWKEVSSKVEKRTGKSVHCAHRLILHDALHDVLETFQTLASKGDFSSVVRWATACLGRWR